VEVEEEDDGAAADAARLAGLVAAGAGPLAEATDAKTEGEMTQRREKERVGCGEKRAAAARVLQTIGLGMTTCTRSLARCVARLVRAEDC